MEVFKRALRGAVLAIGVSLALMGVIGNLFFSTLSEQGVTAMTTEAPNGVSEEQEDQNAVEQEPPSWDREKALDNQIAALRMARNQSWQKLQSGLQLLQIEEKQQLLGQYERLHYKEQRLELLLQAKGIGPCLVVLEEEQANVIVAEDVLTTQYEKIYDLVRRNTQYEAEQILLLPLQIEEVSP